MLCYSPFEKNSGHYQWPAGGGFMWIILLLLWLLPVALGIVVAARVLGGLPAASNDEWRMLFRDTKNFKVSTWMGFTFATLAIVFFFLGVLEGLVLINLGSYWLMLVPLLTGLAAMLVVIVWLRTGARESQIRHTVRPRVRNGRRMLSR
jgi:hypothetical protein